MPRKKSSSHDRPRPEGSSTDAPSDPSADLRAAEPEAPSGRLGFPLVGIGASAGGLGALESFFSGMPGGQDVGMAFVIVQHLAPDHKSLLSDLIGRYTRMQVSEVEDGTRVEPNRVYIIPPNTDLALDGDVLRLHPPEAPRGHRLPIDFFFRSLADALQERAICIVLSGTGSDGTLGVRAVKGSGGMAMAQAPDTAEHDGMPRSAINTGMVDYVMAPIDMPGQLMAYARMAFSQAGPVASVASDGSILKGIAALLRAQTGHDFTHYKSTTLIRRVQRRMALHQIEDPLRYIRFARENAPEIESLFRDLMIGVTSFFRDTEAFKVLQEQVIPQILNRKSNHDQIRVWTCGCSTGEEAYSIAILFQEQIEARKRPYKVQIFATDLDRHAVETARSGIYPASIAADVSAERLTRFFSHQAERDCYRVQKPIRDMLIFSEQDVVKDPPFSKLDLITCRNLLIYLSAEIQRKLIPLFHYALNPSGFLFLGTAETIGEFGRLFTPVDRKWKIFHRETTESGIARTGFPEFSPPAHDLRTAGANRRLQSDVVTGQASVAVVTGQASLRVITEQALLAHYAEAGLLVNGRGDILYILGRTGRYLEPATGDPVLNVLAMARDGLRRELAAALHKAVAHRQPVQHRALKVVTDTGGHLSTDLNVRPVSAHADGTPSDLYLVVLQENMGPEPHPDEARDPGEAANGEVARLERELRAKEDYLQTTLEEMETTNEELKSTNEEMQSVNEELQSTNEELETSKEELQSVNEELSTVNAELQDKVADLSRVNNDMNNLLAGTGVGTVFVDHQLRISRFTPAATQVINLIPTDVGRPVEHVASNLVGYGSLNDALSEVLTTLVPKETEVRTRAGVWYLMRIRPYRTISNVIEGAVLTFVDISERKRAEEALAASEARFLAILNGSRFGLAQIEVGGRFLFANAALSSLIGASPEEITQLRFQDLLSPGDGARFFHGVADLEQGDTEFRFAHHIRGRTGGERFFESRISAIRDAEGKLASLVLSSHSQDESSGGP